MQSRSRRASTQIEQESNYLIHRQKLLRIKLGSKLSFTKKPVSRDARSLSNRKIRQEERSLIKSKNCILGQRLNRILTKPVRLTEPKRYAALERQLVLGSKRKPLQSRSSRSRAESLRKGLQQLQNRIEQKLNSYRKQAAPKQFAVNFKIKKRKVLAHYDN